VGAAKSHRRRAQVVRLDKVATADQTAAMPADASDESAELARVRRELADLRRRVGPFAPGTFHSPIPDLDEVRRDDARLFEGTARELAGIDRNEAHQWRRLHEIAAFAGDEVFPRHHEPQVARYHWDNQTFGYGDAFVLHAMLRLLRPARLIEIGSGFSSAVLLDTLDRHPELPTRATFVEPDPVRLRRLLRPADWARVELLEQRVQDVPLSRFGELGANDVLFIDSSHVAKIGSDVNFLFFEVLPRLPSGCFVHVHDIPPDFEYPRPWVMDGWAWNEAYLLRAFLQHNAAFEIDLHLAWLGERDSLACSKLLPACVHAPGVSIWLRRK